MKKKLLHTSPGRKVAFVGVFGVIGVVFLLAAHAVTVLSGVTTPASRRPSYNALAAATMNQANPC